jgi:hypothetical protein
MKSVKTFGGKTILAVVLLAAQAIIAMSPLLTAGWFASHDGAYHLERIFAVTNEMKFGDFYPRWLSAACAGKGLPVLNFYSPAFFLITGYLHYLGIPLVTVLKIVSFAAFFIGSFGMYLWVRDNLNEAGALIAATMYMFVPYHFLDFYVRGAFPEFMALALLPFLFHAIDISLSADRHFPGIMLTAVTSAAIILTHNLTAFMVTPFALLLFCWHAYSRKIPRSTLLKALSGPLLGAGLSAFYWLPVIIETRHLGRFKATLTGGYLTHSDHFIYPFQWFSSFWGFGASVPGPGDGMSFQIGCALLTGLTVASVSLIFAPRKERVFGLITLVMGLLGLFLTTSFSSFVYELIPWLEFIQFPWRFLGIATLFLAAFTGLSACSAMTTRNSWVQKIILCVSFVLCVLFSANQRRVNANMHEDLDQLEKTKLEDQSIGLLGELNEYFPKMVPTYSRTETKLDPVLPLDAPTAHIMDVSTKGSAMSFKVATPDDSLMKISWFYFPGWQAEIDGGPEPVGVARGGFISLNVPAGTHSVRLWFGTTWPRMLGWLIASLATLIMCAAILWQQQGRTAMQSSKPDD